MRSTLLMALAWLLLAAEVIAQFIVRDQTWAVVLFGLTAATVAVRWALGPDEETCPADCLKCADDIRKD
ncbi:hypothetical protein [Streptomyces rubiginosohelvolus]|uniref:hypothetical protein n=1 Tax=Streptomyces rubiginosohelvolus TaxID=67362 RepID=UPI0035D6246C